MLDRDLNSPSDLLKPPSQPKRRPRGLWLVSFVVLIFLGVGRTASAETRTQVTEVNAATSGVTVTNVTDQGYAAFRVSTPDAVYVYHKPGGGFSRLLDDGGKDWISWNSAAGNAGDFRGIPNMVHPTDGGYFHPGRTTSTTKLISQSAAKVVFESTSKDGQWKVRWEIFEKFARMTVLKMNGNYWFLYEGTPGGALDSDDIIIRSNKVQTGPYSSWARDLDGAEWIYLSDRGVGRSLFLVHHTQDTVVDSYTPSSDKLMTIFGFGREGNRRYQIQVGDQFSFGLVNSTSHNVVAQAVQAALAQE